jgi:hypothetical protein
VSPKPPIGEGPPVTLTGVVAEGVEHGCRILRSGTTGWLLVGGDPALLRPGARVEVVGVPSDDHPTTCQQGKPLIVQRASRL